MQGAVVHDVTATATGRQGLPSSDDDRSCHACFSFAPLGLFLSKPIFLLVSETLSAVFILLFILSLPQSYFAVFIRHGAV
jgi:hypothetical protein